MSTSSSHTSFFSFGPEDSFISRSFEGLRYRNLPSSLHELLIDGSVLDVHWACLGQQPDSWVLSFKDSSGKNNLGWGQSIPSRLQLILSKLAPSPHLRCFLGPKESFIAWNPFFLRWANLPPSLEDSIQSWISPAGWKAGPPRIATWGPHDAFFTMSEYGDVAYRFGSEDHEWDIWKETVDEWKNETGFVWSELAYISLDPTTPDQFIAIRNDGTWAGSIDDDNADALSAFVSNFFRLSKTRSKSKPKPQTNGYQTNDNSKANHTPKPVDIMPDPATQALYEQWATETATLFASAIAANQAGPKRAPKKLQIRSQSSKSTMPTTSSIPTSANSIPRGKLLSSFPYLPSALTNCRISICIAEKADDSGLRACRHDVEKLLRASGLYSYEWLRQERIRWHPDRFGRLCEERWRDEGRRLSEEMFKIIDSLIADVQKEKRSNGTA